MPSDADAQYYNPRAFQITSAGSNGLARGQVLRYVWTNLADTEAEQRAIGFKHVSVRLLGADGDVIAQDEAPAAGPGQFQWFEFDRDRMSLPGEPGTGRLQVRLEATISGDIKGPDAMPALLDSFDDSAEVVETITGRTLLRYKPKEIGVVETSRPTSGPGGTDSVWIDLGGGVFGFMPEQTFRVTVLNPFPPAADADDPTYTMRFAVTLMDADGRVLARTDGIALERGEFRSLDFASADLPMTGEPDTGRVQLRCEIERRYFQGIAARISQGKSTGVLELIDSRSGGTVLLLPAVQTAHEAVRTPQP